MTSSANPSRLCAGLVPAIVALAALQFASPLYADTPSSFDHSSDLVLFVGLEVSVEHDGRFGTIRRVVGDDLDVEIDGKLERVRLGRDLICRTRRDVRIGRQRATIEAASAEPCFSASRDPMRQVLASQSLMYDAIDEHQDRLARAEVGVGTAVTNLQNAPAGGEFAARENLTHAMENLQDVSRTMGVQAFDPIAMANKGSRDGVAPYDALDLSFRISTRDHVVDAFMILVLDVLAPNNPTKPLTLISARRLPPLSEKPRKISLIQEGLPDGYGLAAYRIHVFADGREIGTNLSEKAVGISRDEAFQFLFWRYLNENKKQNRPPVPVFDLLPSDFASLVPTGERTRPVKVSVDAEGNVGRFTLDPAQSGDADALIEELVRAARFFPALENGRPRGAEIAMVLGDFLR